MSPIEGRRVVSPVKFDSVIQPMSASPSIFRNGTLPAKAQKKNKYFSNKNVPRLDIGLVLKHKKKVIDFKKQLFTSEYLTNDL